jgi:hypothetical protein
MATIRYRLMSQRPSATDFGIRNDRYHYNHEKPEQQLEAARKEMMQWQNIEPYTRFKIEQQVNLGPWEDLPRNSLGGTY